MKSHKTVIVTIGGTLLSPYSTHKTRLMPIFHTLSGAFSRHFRPARLRSCRLISPVPIIPKPPFAVRILHHCKRRARSIPGIPEVIQHSFTHASHSFRRTRFDAFLRHFRPPHRCIKPPVPTIPGPARPIRILRHHERPNSIRMNIIEIV
jgi:hypothetical protein